MNLKTDSSPKLPRRLHILHVANRTAARSVQVESKLCAAMAPMEYHRDPLWNLVYTVCGRLFSTPHVPKRDLPGKHIMITGDNSGVGFTLAQHLATMGATVHMACRNLDIGEVAARQHRDHITSGNQVKKVEPDVRIPQLDTSGFTSVRRFVDYIVFTSSGAQYIGAFDQDFALNAEPRTAEHGFHYPTTTPLARPSALYTNTKLMQVAFAKLLQQRFNARGSHMSAGAYSPGSSRTEIMSKIENPSV